ncbi:MAG: glycosyltransferase family 4 protein [Nitrospirae bacterium]|nr:glycosyltransferase family 4 protein [Nitrospirota bacterium]
MISVLHICTDFWPSTGGIEEFVLQLAKRSDSVGIKASVLCFNRMRGHHENLPVKETIQGVPITRIPFLNFKYYKPTLLPLKLLKECNLLHVHGIGAPLDYVGMTKWLHKKPIILSTHGGIFHTNSLLSIKRIYFHGIESFILNGVNVVVACSESDRALFKQISERVILLENAADVTVLLQLCMDAKENGRCLYVGRLSENKGIPALLNAFAVAKNLGAQFSLRLAGPDENGHGRKFGELAHTLGISENVVFLGKVNQDELLEEYHLAENFVSASNYEGFGISAIEAKAAGCRLILNSNDAFRSLFQHDPAADLVDFSDFSTTGKKISLALSNRPNPVVISKRNDAMRFSWETKIMEWRDLYFKYHQ